MLARRRVAEREAVLDLRHGPAEDPVLARVALRDARVRLRDLVARQLDPIIIIAAVHLAPPFGGRVFTHRRDFDALGIVFAGFTDAVDARRAR